MKKLILMLAMLISVASFSQTYVSTSLSAYDGTGDAAEKLMPTVEFGHTFKNVFSLGLAVGKTSFTGAGNSYGELRGTLTVFSKGDFSLAGSLGAGWLPDATEKFMTEYAGTITYMPKNVGISLFSGQYHFNGSSTASKATFIGLGLMFSFAKLPASGPVTYQNDLAKW